REEAVREAVLRRREAKLKARRRAWQDEERIRIAAGRRPRREPTWKRPHLTVDERSEAARGTRAYGLIDYFYRLRIKANYEDARMFTDGPEDQVSSRRVHGDLRRIVASVLLATELHVRQRVGDELFSEWVGDWIKSRTPA